MSQYLNRDEFYKHRLSSFLFDEGGLNIKKIAAINRHVFHVQTAHNKEIILKAHQNKMSVHQQWLFFEEMKDRFSHIVPFIPFPNGNQTIKHKHLEWTISPYIPGSGLNYKREGDRTSVLQAVKRFHKNAVQIHLPLFNKKALIIERWNRQLNTFKKTNHLFAKHSFEKLYMDIVQLTERYLSRASRMPWSTLEIQAVKAGTWVHGDVASHNFIRHGQLYLIDFDLLRCAPQIYDLIQLGQRFLPKIDWDLDHLLTYDMVAQHHLNKWLLGILIPTDVIREWLHFLSQKPEGSIPLYLQKMEKAWARRKKFSSAAESMLKSL